MAERHPRPTAKVRAGHWPQAPHGTTYIDVADPVTGATCTIELCHDIFSPHGSLKVQLHNPQGAIHLCSPVQCVWASSNEKDQAELRRLTFYCRFGRYPTWEEVTTQPKTADLVPDHIFHKQEKATQS